MQMADWIKSHLCTHVAMKSTGVYWKPIYNLLELEELQVMVVNAQHIKAVPGRKTDVKGPGHDEAMIQGGEDPEALSELAKKRLKNNKVDLQRAFTGADRATSKANA